MPEIEAFFRLCLTIPHAVTPFLMCACLTDAFHTFMSFTELERAGWIALVWLTVDALWKIIRWIIRRKPPGGAPPATPAKA